MTSGFDDITTAAANAVIGRRSFAEATGVSDRERRAQQVQVRNAAGSGAAERVSLRFEKVVKAFKSAEGRSPATGDAEVWKALTTIVREEVGG